MVWENVLRPLLGSKQQTLADWVYAFTVNQKIEWVGKMSTSMFNIVYWKRETNCNDTKGHFKK